VTAPGADGQAEHMMLGLFVTSGYHRVVDSKAFQGQHPVWTAAIDGTLASSRPVHFGESFFDDGEKREFNAETVCSELDCTNPLVDYDRFSLSRYTGPRSGKHLPILLRSDFPEGVTATPELRARFEADVRKFSQGLDVASLLDRAGSPQDQ